MDIRKTFKYRIYPTKEQVKRIESWGNALRFLWNLANEQRLAGSARQKGERKYYTAYDQINQLKELRKEVPWLADVPRDVSAQLLVELDKAWKLCFNKISSRPRWKSKNRGDNVTLCESHPKAWRVQDGQLVFPKLGKIKVVMHRPLEGTRKTCSLVREGDQWFACVTSVVEIEEPTPPLGKPVGLDRGITKLVADSNGEFHNNHRFLEKSQRKLARAQRRLAKKKRGSKNRKKAKIKVANTHRKIRRQRNHVLHQISHYYAKSHSVVVIEDLKVKNMVKSRLARSIADASWSTLRNQLIYKCKWYGSTLLEVDPAYTSQTCSECGAIDKASRSGVRFACTSCGATAHADTNAAKNILSRGVPGVAACGGYPVRGPMKQEPSIARS